MNRHVAIKQLCSLYMDEKEMQIGFIAETLGFKMIEI